MLFRIAGAGQMQLCILLQELHHVAGMGKIPARILFVGHVPGPVAPQSQHIIYIGFF